MLKYLLSFFSIALLITATSCGGDSDDKKNNSDGPVVLPQEEQDEGSNFSTRLNNRLLIAGTNCQGEETTEYGGETYTCTANEWLITVDNVNTCTNGGVCTEIGVIPIVATLEDADVVSIPEYSFYKVTPVSPTTSSQRRSLNQIYIRMTLEGQTEAVLRTEDRN